MVNGHRTDHLRNSRHEAGRASRLLTSACGLEVIVEPVIVVMAAELVVKSPPTDVHVVARKRISRWMARRPAALAPSAVEAIFEHARRDTTRT